MSVIIARIEKQKNISYLKKILNVFTSEVKVMSDEKYRDSRFAELIEEAKDSVIVSEEKIKKEFKKRGLSY